MMEVLSNTESLGRFCPELTLTTFLVLVILFDAFSKGAQRIRWTTGLAIAGLALAALAVFVRAGQPVLIFEGTLITDWVTVFFQCFFILTALIVVILLTRSSELGQRIRGESLALIMAATLAMCVVAASANLMIAYLSLEFVSIASYVLSGLARRGERSDEASMKFVLYGAACSGVMLYGFSWLYGMAGSLDLIDIRRYILEGNANGPVLIAVAGMVLVGLGYKIAAFPVHFWAPDVYEGSPTPITAYFAVASKGAGFALLLRFFSTFIPAFGMRLDQQTLYNLQYLLLLVSVVTMTYGNLAALVQKNVKRMMGYSSIAHAGYILMGACVLTRAGTAALLFYLAGYFFTVIAAFGIIILVANRAGETLRDYRGLWRRMPWAVVAMCIALFSLIGIPPTAGFFGKLYLLLAVFESYQQSGQRMFIMLILAALINTVISLYYYARVMKAMCLEQSEEAEAWMGGQDIMIPVGVMVAGILFIGILPGSLMSALTEWSRQLYDGAEAVVMYLR